MTSRQAGAIAHRLAGLKAGGHHEAITPLARKAAMTLTARQKADYLVRDLFRERHGIDVPYEPHRELKGHRIATAMKALARLGFPAEDQDRFLKQYMNFWDDATYAGLARYLANLLARHPVSEE